MTGKVVSISDSLRVGIDDEFDPPCSPEERFLFDEGLELLASYRAIRDRAMRLKVKALIDMIAQSQER